MDVWMEMGLYGYDEGTECVLLSFRPLQQLLLKSRHLCTSIHVLVLETVASQAHMKKTILLCYQVELLELQYEYYGSYLELLYY